MSTIRTSGINYEPTAAKPVSNKWELAPQDFNHVDGDGGAISTLHLELKAQAKFGDTPIDLISPFAACGSACRTRTTAVPGVRDVEILRFAKDGFSPLSGTTGRMGLAALGAIHKFRQAFGSADGPFGVTWLVTMEEGHALAGVLRNTQVDETGAVVGGNLVMGGRMVLTHKPSWETAPQRLLSRKEPLFEAVVSSWPPKGSTLKLQNPPIEYFNEFEVDIPGAEPILTISTNEITFGNDTVRLLEVTPQITSIVPVDPDGAIRTSAPVAGMRITWMDTSRLVPSSEPPVAFYNIYRQFDGDTLNGWFLVRSVPSTVTSWVDTANQGQVPATYIVLHAAAYPFGYKYESLIGIPVSVPAIM